MSLAVGTLAVIALVAALYFARAFFVPLLIGILASYALHPVVDWLKVYHDPRAVGAAVALAVLPGCLSWIAFSLSNDAAATFERLPEAARKLRQNLSAERTSAPTALQNIKEAAKKIEGATADAGAKPGARVVAVRPSESTAWLSDYALAQSRLLMMIVAQTPIIVLLTYVLLASGAIAFVFTILAAQLVRARERRGTVHCVAVLRLAVGYLGPAARRVIGCHRQGGLRSGRIVEAGGRTARALATGPVSAILRYARWRTENVLGEGDNCLNDGVRP